MIGHRGIISEVGRRNDPYWGSVTLALPMYGANNSTTFVDLKGRTVSRIGTPIISSTKSKFNGTSAYFDGNGDALSVTGVSFGTGNFTIEGWINVSSAATTFVFFDSRTADDSLTGFIFYIRSTRFLTFGWWNGSSFIATSGSTLVSADTWYHVELTRSSGTIRGFLGGVQEFSVSNSQSFSLTGWKIGSQYNAPSGLSAGYIDELRITTGIARHTSGFTPNAYSCF